VSAATPLWLALLLVTAAPRLPNANCQWSPQPYDPIDLSRPGGLRRLAAEAQYAEDLAIRYADRCCGPHSGTFEDMEAYGRRRDECMATLFHSVAQEHGVTEPQVHVALSYRRPEFDAAVIVSFAIQYAALSYFIAGEIRKRTVNPAILTVYVSGICAVAGVMAFDVWCGAMEDLRVGNGHLSYRGERIPWMHHRPSLWAAGVLLFWAMALWRRRSATSA
jgi:hypothetical protein